MYRSKAWVRKASTSKFGSLREMAARDWSVVLDSYSESLQVESDGREYEPGWIVTAPWAVRSAAGREDPLVARLRNLT
jgi:hypothetical protein